MRPTFLLPICILGACARYVDVEHPAPSVTTPLPGYPAMLRAAFVDGVVSLAVPVSVEGVPQTRVARVVASSHDLFLLSVKRAVDSWRFQPARRNGIADADTVRIRFAFKLDSSAHCGPSRIIVRPGDPEPQPPVQAPATATFDPQRLSGVVTACRPITIAHILY